MTLVGFVPRYHVNSEASIMGIRRFTPGLPISRHIRSSVGICVIITLTEERAVGNK